MAKSIISSSDSDTDSEGESLQHPGHFTMASSLLIKADATPRTMSTLPQELQFIIFSYFRPEELLQFGNVSKSWNQAKKKRQADLILRQTRFLRWSKWAAVKQLKMDFIIRTHYSEFDWLDPTLGDTFDKAILLAQN